MKVLLVSQDFPPAIGGIETYAWELGRRLADVTSLSASAPALPRAASVDAQAPFDVVRVRARPDLLPLALLGHLPLRARVDRWDVSFHAQWQTALAALTSRRLTGFPRRIAVAAHGRELLFNPFSGRAASLYDRVRRFAVARADVLLPVSRYTAGLLRDLGAPPDRIHVVSNGTDFAQFRPVDAGPLRQSLRLDGRRVILTVARLVGRKGVDTVIDAMPAVLGKYPQTTYLVVGDGPERERLEARARSVAPQADIRFLGRISHADLPAYYSMADFAVMPSRNEPPDVEGFGLVFLEANACGCAVIGADSGGISDAVLHERTGLLVPPADVAALADAMIRLLSDHALRRRLAEEGRRRVIEDANWDRAAERIVAHLHAIVEEDADRARIT